MSKTSERDVSDPLTFNATHFLKSVPKLAGVYRMKNREGEIIYVGKAKNLKNRLSSYFRQSGLPPKTRALVANIASIELTITETEREALLLESNLIKAHRPRYNVRLIDDKSYPYIALSKHRYPRLSFYRGNRQRDRELYGPYPSSGAVFDVLNLMKKIFKVRQCDDTFFANRSRPCLQYQIDRCSAPCVHKISEERYREDVEAVRLFLKGKSSDLITSLGEKMQAHSAALEFEAAATIRDQIQQINEIQSSNMMESSGGRESLDIFILRQLQEWNLIEVLTLREGRVLGTRSYEPQVPPDTEQSEILSSFISQYYGDHRLPPPIVVAPQIEKKGERDLLAESLTALADRIVKVQTRLEQSRARWLKMTEENAEQSLKVKLAGVATIQHRLQALKRELALEEIPTRIDCFDISHTFGERTVAAKVSYTEEGLTPSLYRRFNIEGAKRGDDYGALEEALRRYFSGQGGEMPPDLLLIDGGKGQLKIAHSLLEQLGYGSIPLYALSQGAGKIREADLLWQIGSDVPITLNPHSPAFHLLAEIRDEAHRFAISGHRARRDRARRRSLLEDIEGIGKVKRQALLTHFGGLEQIKRASVADIQKVKGISERLAIRVYEALNPEK